MLKPVGYNLDLRYVCPKCQSDIWVSEADVNAGVLLQCCGARLRFSKFTSNVHLSFGGSKPNKAVEVLRSLGFNTPEVIQMAIDLSKAHDYEYVVKECIANVK